METNKDTEVLEYATPPARRRLTAGTMVVLTLVGLVLLWGIAQAVVDIRWARSHPAATTPATP